MTARISRASEFFRKTPGGYVSPFDERGFEIGDGWLYLALSLAFNIERVLKVSLDRPVYRCEQIKQKFGRLEVYFTRAEETTSARIEGLIKDTQREASETCEMCRGPGRLVDTNGHQWVACPTHSSKLVPTAPHAWELEEVDGGHVGVGTFYVCRACGASGGPQMTENFSKVMSPYPPFLAGTPDHRISLNCNIAKQQIKELTCV